MGHANLENISNFFLRMLGEDQVLVSINDCVKALQEAGETFYDSEGDYNEEYMLAASLEGVVEHLLNYPEGPVIKPYITFSQDEQRNLYEQWKTPGYSDDWGEKEYQVFDEIEWTLETEWRNRYNEVEPLTIV